MLTRNSSIKQICIYSLLFITALLTFIFVILKAKATSFTHDESFTYLHYVHEPFMDIISYKHPYTNNHILNTVFMKYVEEFFGTSEVLLRLPNIIACFIYLIYSFKLQKYVSPVLIIPCFFCLLCNTALIDFFSLARGYGLSFAFMLMSLYHLINYFYTYQKKQLIWFNLAALLAVLSNFSLLNFYVSALITYNIIVFIDVKLNKGNEKFFKYLLRSNVINLIAIVISAAILYEPLRRIIQGNMLDFGGKDGIIANTFDTLFRGILYETVLPQLMYTVMPFMILIMLLCIACITLKNILLKNILFFKEHKSLVISFCIISGILLMSQVQHYLLNTDYYTDRFALFLYPLLVLNFSYCINYLYQSQKSITAIIGYSLALILLINTIANLNINFYREWKYDRSTKTVMELLEKEYNLNPAPIKLGVNWLFEPTTNFYRYTHNLHWLTKTDRKGLKLKDDYYFLLEADTNAYLANGKQILFKDEINHLIFVKNK